MSRKLAILSLGVVCVMFVVGLSLPSFATFTQDTLVLNGTTDTTSLIDTIYVTTADSALTMLSAASDDSGNLYVLHTHFEAHVDTRQRLLVTKTSHDGSNPTVLTVATNHQAGRFLRRTVLAVNRRSQAIYVVAATETDAFVYTDTGTHNNTTFPAPSVVPGFRLPGMSPTFGAFHAAVYGGSAQDSLWIVAAKDTEAAGSWKGDSGVMLWRFSSLGVFKDSDLLYYRRGTDSGHETGTILTRTRIPSAAYIIPVSRTRFGLLLVGNRPQQAQYPDSEYWSTHDTISTPASDSSFAIYYDTWEVTDAGGVESNETIDTIGDTWILPTGEGNTSETSYALGAAFDSTNNRIVVYYAMPSKAGMLRRAYITPGARYSSSNDVDIDDNFPITVLGSLLDTPAALSVVIDNKISGQSVKEHVAFISKSKPWVFYVKREAGATTTNLDFDTVSSLSLSGAVHRDTRVAIAVSNAGSPRVFFTRTLPSGEVMVHIAKPQALALASGAGIAVSNAQQTTSTSAASSPTLTLTIVPPVNDDGTPQFAQAVLSQPSTSTKTSSSLSDFSTPTYTVVAPLGNSTGDTLTCEINAKSDNASGVGIALYIRRPSDTTPSGGANAFDTNMFSSLTDSQITVLAGMMVKLRIGDTAGRLFDDDKISESGVATRVKLVMTPSFLESLVDAGIDTTNLSIWKATGTALSTANDFQEVGASFTASDLHDGGNFTLTSNAITSFSFIIPAPGSPAVSPSGGGVCVVGKCLKASSPTFGALRAVRDAMMSTKLGRVLTSWYYNLK